MKRKQLALSAMLACCSAAWAQSKVTLYGVIDTNIEYVNNVSPTLPGTPGFPGPASNKFAMSSGGLSGTRWGLRGEEDLGAGAKGVFVLESGFGSDDGKMQQGGRIFGRQAFVGLQSNLGTLTFGRQYTSLFEALANFSPTAYSTQYEPVIFMTGLNFRSDNMVKYTGAFGSFTANAHWTFGNGVFGGGEVPGQFNRDNGYGVGLSYLSGPFGAAVGFDATHPSMTVFGDSGVGKAQKAFVAGSYAIGPAKIVAGYRWEKSNYSVNNATFIRDDLYWLGLNYQATPALSLTAAYYYDDLKRLQLSSSGTSANPANPWQITLIADYNLSKRTDVYLTTAYSKNAGLNFDTSAIGFANGYYLGAGKNSMFGAALGLRHKF